MTQRPEPASTGLWRAFLNTCGTPADRKNNWRLMGWTAAWAVGLTVSSMLLKGRFGTVVPGSVASIVVALVPAVLFLGVIATYLRMLRETDELQRQIQLQALAVGFGAGVLLLMHWELFERIGLPQMDPSDAVMVPVLAWVLSLVYLARRYR